MLTESQVRGWCLPEGDILSKRAAVRRDLLGASRCIDRPQFEAIHHDDVGLLFARYDAVFFSTQLTEALAEHETVFRVSRRLKKSAGLTTLTERPGQRTYGIAIASDLLLGNFDPPGEAVSVAGVPCADRVAGLQIVFEHELVHLIELLVWGRTECAADRFGTIAAGVFGHRSTYHQLLPLPALPPRPGRTRPAEPSGFAARLSRIWAVIRRPFW